MTCENCAAHRQAYELLLKDLLERDKQLLAAREILGQFYGKCFIDTEIQKILEKWSKVD